MDIKIFSTRSFDKQKKKLPKNYTDKLEEAIKVLAKTPHIGQQKKGNLAGVYVYKFKITSHEILLAYQFDKKELILLYIGSHENFYRDLKKNR